MVLAGFVVPGAEQVQRVTCYPKRFGFPLNAFWKPWRYSQLQRHMEFVKHSRQRRAPEGFGCSQGKLRFTCSHFHTQTEQ